MPPTLLIIGAGGFIGGFIAAEGLRRGYRVTVAVRASTSRRYLSDPRLRFVVLDYDDPASLAPALAAAAPDGNPWDYIIYNLGATKALNFLEFNLVNYEYLRRVVAALRSASLLPRRFLYMSSLSALGPADEKGFTPLSASTVPNPNTRYGLSKIKAEQWLEHQSGLDYIIFRPTGVYGPHERDYLMMIRCIQRHFDFSVGLRRQLLTFIYVDDLVTAMFQALEAGVCRRAYILSEPRAYSQSEFRRLVATEAGVSWVIPVKLPIWAVWLVSALAERIGRLRGKPSTLNRDKFRIMRQRNWQADISPAQADFGFNPRVSLAEGIRRTLQALKSPKS